MSNRKNLMYTKILIDLEEYIKLLHIQERVNKQEEVINARLQKEKQPTPETISAKDAESDEPLINIDNSQTGSGSNLINDDLIKHITSLVTQQIQSQFHLVPQQSNNQEGAGANDLIREIPEELPKPEEFKPENTPVSTVIQKSQLNDNFDNERLINSVPLLFRARAEKLLKDLLPFSSDISFTSSGTIFINQNSLPSSNIYQIFPYLFKPVKSPDNYPNLLEIATKIASLGLGHLINRRLTLGLIRKKAVPDQDKLHLQIKTSKHWWYLGP